MKRLLAVILCSLLAVPAYGVIAATVTFEVESGGSDSANGGCFDPGQTAGMFTDGAATSATGTAPVFTSASYNFVAGDVAAWVYIASGTNWVPGWYKIASVASNAATLTATIGAGVLANYSPTTAAGVASTASPTAATWSIDYSQQAAAIFSYTDMASAGTGLTVSSAAHPFAKQQVGNCLVVASGTNFTAGRYVIASVAAAVATVQGPTNITTGVGASGVGGLGGAILTLGTALGINVSGNKNYVKNGTYSVSTTITVPSGVNDIGRSAPNILYGYNSVRGDNPLTTSRPTITTATSTLVLLTVAGNNWRIANFIFDAANTGNTGISVTTADAGRGLTISNVKVANFKTSGFVVNGSTGIVVNRFEITGGNASCTEGLGTAANPFSGTYADGWIHANACPGVSLNGQNGLPVSMVRINSSRNTSATGHGFNIDSPLGGFYCDSCIAEGNAGDGIKATGSDQTPIHFTNSIIYGNTGTGLNFGFAQGPVNLAMDYNGVGGNGTNRANVIAGPNDVTLTGAPFTNASTGDYSLNNTAGAGAALRATGFPGVFPGGSTTGYKDIGPTQHQDAGGSTVTVGYPSVR